MNTANVIRGIAIGIVWFFWGIGCLVWDIDPGDLGDSLLGGAFHLIWGVVTLAGLTMGGVWFLEVGADMLGEWYDKRNPRDGGGISK